ncbi:hypothetical protein LARV_03785 [Longilinea arvoryzae]|uniref:Uncharacterized protein n=1 Tax=Longilinea arvoryzae TaxID=360412 RepID=A0A0K8MXR1_9CHLR|nr:hypothetical protein [Longilinea arvoryzae]GAP15990.1 hypothetical protein LARV_03785 [Longilinea arvoryzae]
MGWLDVLDLGLDVVQTVQIHSIKNQLNNMQSGQVNEQIRAGIIETYKNFVFSVNQDLKEIQKRVQESPKQVHVVSLILEWRLKESGISPEVFKDLSDKEYLAELISGIKEVKNQSFQLLNATDRSQAERAAQDIIDVPALDAWMKSRGTLKELKSATEDLERITKSNRMKKKSAFLSLFAIVCACVLSTISPAAIVQTISWILLIGGLVVGVYSLITRKKGKERTLTTTIRLLEDDLPPSEDLDRLQRSFGKMSISEAQALRERKIAAIQAFMGSFKGYENISMIP